MAYKSLVFRSNYSCIYMFSRFGRVPACDGQTDGRTDILLQHSPRYAYASLGKKLRFKRKIVIRCQSVPKVLYDSCNRMWQWYNR